MQDMQPIFLSAGRALKSVDLVELQKRLHILLPADYRRFLLRQNGGRPFPNTFRGGFSVSVDEFLSIRGSRHDDFERFFRFYVKQQRVPPGLVPIAHGPGGLILINVKHAPQRGVFAWYEELDPAALEADEAVPEFRFHRTRKLADSFLEFLRSCARIHSPRTGGEPKRETAELLATFTTAGAEPSVDRLRALLKSGADPDACDASLRYTVLHHAAGSGQNEVVELLLEHGADPDARTRSGETPLHLAALGSRRKAIRLLLQAGADVRARGMLTVKRR